MFAVSGRAGTPKMMMRWIVTFMNMSWICNTNDYSDWHLLTTSSCRCCAKPLPARTFPHQQIYPRSMTTYWTPCPTLLPRPLPAWCFFTLTLLLFLCFLGTEIVNNWTHCPHFFSLFVWMWEVNLFPSNSVPCSLNFPYSLSSHDQLQIRQIMGRFYISQKWEEQLHTFVLLA